MLAHYGERFLRFRVTQKPLLAQARLDRDFAPLAKADVVFIRLGFREQSLLLQHLRGVLARLESIESIQLRHRRTIYFSVRMKHVDNRQLVALADFEIDLVMRRRHFQNAGAELWIDRFVSDD